MSSARSPVSVSLGPISNLAEGVDFFHALQHGLIGHGMHFGEAQEIGAALHDRNFPFGSKVLLQERDVFLVELFLQGLGGGGDDDAAAAADGGKKIGEGFAGAGARFQDGVVVILEGVVDGLGHLQLGRAVLVATDHAFIEEAAGTEDVAHGRLAGAFFRWCSVSSTIGGRIREGSCWGGTFLKIAAILSSKGAYTRSLTTCEAWSCEPRIRVWACVWPEYTYLGCIVVTR